MRSHFVPIGVIALAVPIHVLMAADQEKPKPTPEPILCRGNYHSEEDAVYLPIDGTLDLHTFPPGEVKNLLGDYIEACLARGIADLRIVHGKGKGVLRRIVHAALERHPKVKSFELGGMGGGSWGATRAVLDLD